MSDSDSEEEDIYHTMLLKAYRNTSTPELTAKVAAKLAREQKLSGKGNFNDTSKVGKL